MAFSDITSAISADPIQQIRIKIPTGDVQLTLKYYATCGFWAVDAIRNGLGVYGVNLCLGVKHIASSLLDIDFVVIDNSNLGLDPFKLDDFESGRCSLLVRYNET